MRYQREVRIPMLRNHQNTIGLNAKHRFRKKAMLSALAKFFGILFLIGSAIVLWKFSDFIGNNIPGKVLSVQQAAPAPVRVKIAAVGIDAPVGKLGLNLNGTLAVPAKNNEVGWYIGSPAPGAAGPAIMVGHLDSVNGPAVFENLKNLKTGDEVSISRFDGSTVVFKVDSSQRFSQNSFPTDQVYGSLDYPGLRLITCAGSFSRLSGRYSDNLVVFASLKR
jgi:hypothetical protein